MTLKIAILILALTVGSMARADVWTTSRHWDRNAEAEFGQWIENLPLDIFLRDRIPTDCADAAYTLRALFAWENGLPVHFRLQDDQFHLSNDSTQFDSLDTFQPDPSQPYTMQIPPRVRAFLSYVRNHTNTQTLVDDSYPIAINRRSLVSGVMFLHNGEKPIVPKEFRYGHVYYIQSVNDENGMIRYISSTVPADVRALSVNLGIDFAPWGTDSGYRAWKEPESSGTPWNYSEEQVSMAHWHPNGFQDAALWDRWQAAVQARIHNRLPTAKEQLEAREVNLRSSLQERAEVVMKGWRYYQAHYVRHGQMCMNEGDYGNFSTPTRDRKIQVELQLYQDAATNYFSSQQSDNNNMYSADPASEVTRLMESQQVEVYPGTYMTFAQLENAFLENCNFLPLSEPEHSPAVRWGLQPLSQDQWPCPERLQQYQAALKACSGQVASSAGAPQPVSNIFHAFSSLFGN